MKRILIFVALVSVFLLNHGCNKEDGINMPTVSILNLSYPTNNFLCIDNTITFEWSDELEFENNIVNYTIIIAKDRDFSEIVESSIVNEPKITVTLNKATAYYWKVIASDQNNKEISSEVFAFYTKGEGIVNYAPFSSELVQPLDDSLISANSVDLKWVGSDADFEDTLTYELYFSETSPPNLLENSLTAESYNVTVESGKTYYWRVNVVDEEEAKSIGQIWTFTVN